MELLRETSEQPGSFELIRNYFKDKLERLRLSEAGLLIKQLPANAEVCSGEIKLLNTSSQTHVEIMTAGSSKEDYQGPRNKRILDVFLDHDGKVTYATQILKTSDANGFPFPDQYSEFSAEDPASATLAIKEVNQHLNTVSNMVLADRLAKSSRLPSPF